MRFLRAHSKENTERERIRVCKPRRFAYVAAPARPARRFSTLIQQAHSLPEQFVEYAITVVTILIVALTIWIVLRSSSLIARKLGHHGLIALARVMGFLMVLAVASLKRYDLRNN